MYSLVIVGSGVAGITAAIYAGQGGTPATLLEGDTPGGNFIQSNLVTNWPGARNRTGKEIIHSMFQQAKACHTNFVPSIVTRADFSQRPFILYTPTPIRCWCVIICSGSSSTLLNIPGEAEYWKHGIYSCPTCETSKIKGKTVVVIGGADSAVAKALFAANLAKRVFVIVRANEFHVKKDVAKLEGLLKHQRIEVLYNQTAKAFEGKNRELTHLVLGDGTNLRCDAAFVAVGAYPNIQPFPQLEVEDGALWVDCKTQQTSCPGVFAAGDVCDRTFTQAVTASGAAARAALGALKFLQALNFKPSEHKNLGSVLQHKGSVAVVITSSTCLNCAQEAQKIAQFEEAAKRHEIPFIYIDIDQWNAEMERFMNKLKLHEFVLPILMLIKNGKVDRLYPNRPSLG